MTCVDAAMHADGIPNNTLTMPEDTAVRLRQLSNQGAQGNAPGLVVGTLLNFSTCSALTLLLKWP
jgi:hypothetical protein